MEIKGHIVDVLNNRIYDGAVSVEGTVIRSVRPCAEVPSCAPYIMPGFVDAHMHVESTLCTPEAYARLALRRGTVAAVADPHEIANVLGVRGVEYMIENGRKARFHFAFAASPCVPSTAFETSGAVLDSSDIARLLEKPEIFVLGEMMNVPGVIYDDPETLAKTQAARRAGKPLDGHAPSLGGKDLQKYVAAVSTPITSAQT